MPYKYSPMEISRRDDERFTTASKIELMQKHADGEVVVWRGMPGNHYKHSDVWWKTLCVDVTRDVTSFPVFWDWCNLEYKLRSELRLEEKVIDEVEDGEQYYIKKLQGLSDEESLPQ